jgi:membrane protein YdbS with pleckstrin-like domain
MRKQLHPGARWLFRLQIFWVVIFLTIFLGSFIIPFSITSNIETGSNQFVRTMIYGFILLFVLIAVIGEIWVRMAYNRWFYEFTDSNLKQERGVIWKTYSNVPYERIQNVDIRRGIIARMMGFSTIMIQTAGYSSPMNGRGYNAEGYIPAVGVKEAEQIRDFIIKKITKKKTNQGL